MSTEGFNQLFAGYPDCRETDELRQRVQAAIANSISELRSAQLRLGEASAYKDYALMYDVISSIDTLRLLTLSATLPSIDLAYNLVTQVYKQALHDYITAIENRTRRGVLGSLFPKEGKPTKAEFTTMKAATALVLVDLLAWLASITPNS